MTEQLKELLERPIQLADWSMNLAEFEFWGRVIGTRGKRGTMTAWARGIDGREKLTTGEHPVMEDRITELRAEREMIRAAKPGKKSSSRRGDGLGRKARPPPRRWRTAVRRASSPGRTRPRRCALSPGVPRSVMPTARPMRLGPAQAAELQDLLVAHMRRQGVIPAGPVGHGAILAQLRFPRTKQSALTRCLLSPASRTGAECLGINRILAD